MISGPKKTVSVLMPEALYWEIKKLAEETNRSIPGYIRQILKRYTRNLSEQGGELSEEWKIK